MNYQLKLSLTLIEKQNYSELNKREVCFSHKKVKVCITRWKWLLVLNVLRDCELSNLLLHKSLRKHTLSWLRSGEWNEKGEWRTHASSPEIRFLESATQCFPLYSRNQNHLFFFLRFIYLGGRWRRRERGKR